MRSYRKAWLSFDRKTITHEVPAGRTPSNPGTEAQDADHVTEVALYMPFRQDLPFEIWNYLAPAFVWVSFNGADQIHWVGFDADDNPVADLGTLGSQVYIEGGIDHAQRVFQWDFYANHTLD